MFPLETMTAEPGNKPRVETSTTKAARQRYRSRIEIAAKMLDIAKNGSRKTRIMYLGNLSFDLLQKYLGLLVNSGLIELERDNERMYVTTEKGRRFLEDFHKVQAYSEKAKTKRRALEESLSIQT